MKVKAIYDNERDIAQVDQVGYVDLADCFINGVVPASADIDQLSYNDIDDPASIVGKPSDVFDAINMGKAMRRFVNKDNEE